MKCIFKLSALGLLFLASCSKMLDEKPQTIAAENFYKTPVEIESGLNAVYETVRYLSTFGGFYTLQHEINTEYMYGRGSFSPMNTYQGLDNTNIGRITDTWNNFYKGIRNANLIIQKAPLADITEAEKQRYIGEARFLRGLYYFHLVRNWAGVPLHNEHNMDSINVKKSSAQEIYQLIESDLLYAEANLPDNPRLVGTPSKWVAKTVLAELFLTLQKYDLARKAALEVIQSNKYSLVSVSVADDFEKIFGSSANNTSEEILYFKYSAKVSGQGYQYLAYLHATKTTHFPPGGFATIYSDSLNPFLRDWDRNDLRYRFTWYPSNINVTPTTVLCKKFSDRQATVQTAANNDYPLYRYADLLLFYAEADARVNNGPTADAVEKLNMVRRRAYGKPATTPNPLIDIKLTDYPGTDAFVKRVVLERGYETVGEGKHWFDLKRLGIAEQTIKEVEGLTMAQKHLLWPIPPREFNGNTALHPTLDQNPGY